jgi:hypothetical protein
MIITISRCIKGIISIKKGRFDIKSQIFGTNLSMNLLPKLLKDNPIPPTGTILPRSLSKMLLTSLRERKQLA